MNQKDVDIRLVDKNSLKSINSVKIDSSMDKKERVRSFIEQIGNPHCYMDGDTIVKISYADTDITLEDRLKSYLNSLG